ncbi:hypothetical protein ILUMI_06253 [Ignelater luminosus]|uniref:Uncharacterized protein n=1 Tax=Ignelater luminosus TaxID=2038154 RepID=A0A8K0D9L5_IGNLU|nr:hypothetical protein ILUMI_06253 [Ignelater luminosus]
MPSYRPPTLVMVQPPLPLPTYTGPNFVQPSFVLPPMPASTSVWWDHYAGPSGQQDFVMLPSPESERNGYQSPPFRKRK